MSRKYEIGSGPRPLYDAPVQFPLWREKELSGQFRTFHQANLLRAKGFGDLGLFPNAPPKGFPIALWKPSVANSLRLLCESFCKAPDSTAKLQDLHHLVGDATSIMPVCLECLDSWPDSPCVCSGWSGSLRESPVRSRFAP